MEAGIDEPDVFQDITIKTSDLKFIPFEYHREKKIDMIIYLKNFTIYSHNKNGHTKKNRKLKKELVILKNTSHYELYDQPKL